MDNEKKAVCMAVHNIRGEKLLEVSRLIAESTADAPPHTRVMLCCQSCCFCALPVKQPALLRPGSGPIMRCRTNLMYSGSSCVENHVSRIIN